MTSAFNLRCCTNMLLPSATLSRRRSALMGRPALGIKQPTVKGSRVKRDPWISLPLGQIFPGKQDLAWGKPLHAPFLVRGSANAGLDSRARAGEQHLLAALGHGPSILEDHAELLQGLGRRRDAPPPPAPASWTERELPIPSSCCGVCPSAYIWIICIIIII